MKIYRHHPITKEFLNELDARPDPLTPDKHLIPANCTAVAPPETSEHEAACFEAGEWSIVPDYRGYRYFTVDDGEAVINDLDVVPPEGAVELSVDDRLIQDEAGWRLMNSDDDLALLKAGKILSLETSFNIDLNAGFDSDALGATHRYDSEPHNRENIIGAVAAGVDQLFTCDDLAENPDSKQQRLHTAAQLKQVLIDGAAYKQSLIAKLRDLRGQVDDAEDEAAVDAITWEQ